MSEFVPSLLVILICLLVLWAFHVRYPQDGDDE